MTSPASDAQGSAGLAEPAPAPAAPAPDWPGRVAALWVVASLVGPITVAGIWEPFELNVAELARRIAVNLYGGQDLALEGAVNTMPTRGELARGELPFTSVALGFRLFGLNEWAGRLPLAIFGLLGAGATYVLVRRLADKLTAALSVIALATMPLYFLQARTMLGDIVTMAAYAGSYAGLGLSCFDRRAGERRALLGRVGWGLFGLLSLVVGFLSRGLLLGLAAPALGVGLSWLLLRGTNTLGRERFGDLLGALSLLLGTTASALGVRVLLANLEEPDRYFFSLGFAIEKARTLPAFDAVLLQLGHALFPWSAVIPVALARLGLESPERAGDERERRRALATLVILGPAIAYLAYTLLAPVATVLPFGAVAPLAVIVALGLVDLDRGAPASRTAAMVAGALAIVLLIDFDNTPGKALAGFVIPDIGFPESYRRQALLILAVGTLLFIGLFFLATLETDDPELSVFDRRDYASWFVTLRELWGGNLLFGMLAFEAALIGFVAIDWLGDRLPSLRQYFALGGLARSAARVGWLVVPGVVLAPPVVMALRDCFRALGRLRARGGRARWIPGRGVLALLAPALCGTLLSLVFYPKLGVQLSPKQTFVAYRELAKSGEELAMMGWRSGGASYYAGRTVATFATTDEALTWLLKDDARRWLVIRQGELGPMNAAYRERKSPRANLPVLDATSSEVLLVSNKLEEGETNQNPLEKWVLNRPPTPSHPLDASLAGQLDVLGWEVTDLDGKPVASVRPGRRYVFSIYYEVTASVPGSWETFIHIDGFQRRFNGDHPTLGGKYPFHLFRTGDFIADRYEFSLEPNFSPGAYRVYFGLFSASRRMEVTRGAHDDNRIEGGTLVVD